jgi:hypothetical protein
VGEGRKAFFLERKKQRTFDYGIRLAGYGATALVKVFCFFSSEKKAFLVGFCLGLLRRCAPRNDGFDGAPRNDGFGGGRASGARNESTLGVCGLITMS